MEFFKNLFRKKESPKVEPVKEKIIPPKPKAKPKLSKKDEFIQSLAISKSLGFNDWCVLTHAWHESGGFEHIIGEYNFWGIKKPKKWDGKVLSIKTHEYSLGSKIHLTDLFIDFDTINEALNWYCDFIQRLYTNSFYNRQIPELYFRGLVNGRYKYATDPKYAEKLISLYQTLLLREDIKLNE